MSTEFLKIEGLGKTYPGASEAVFERVNFGIRRGEFVCIIGHSGCGKTTILNTLAGLEHGSEGHVFMDGREVTAPGAAPPATSPPWPPWARPSGPT